MLYKKLDEKQDLALVCRLSTDLIRWAYMPSEYQQKGHEHWRFIDYLELNDLEALVESFLQFITGIEHVDSFRMDLKSLFRQGRYRLINELEIEMSSDRLNTIFPGLDLNKKEKIFEFWREFLPDYYDRIKKTTYPLQDNRVLLMYDMFFENWPRKEYLMKLMQDCNRLKDPVIGYAVNDKITMDILGYGLLKHVQKSLTTHYRGMIQSGQELDNEIIDFYISLLGERPDLLKIHMSEFLEDGKTLKPMAEVMMNTTAARARRILQNFSTVVFGTKDALIPEGNSISYRMLKPAAIQLVQNLYQTYPIS